MAFIPIGFIATRAAATLASTNLVIIADDDSRAAAIAAALAAAMPEAHVLALASSDALPGDPGAASPSNAGARMAAFKSLRVAFAACKRVALVTSAEVAISRQPPPHAFDITPPVVAVGDSLDPPVLVAALEAAGYFTDDRVDEPGEIGVRGAVIDIFPADAPTPVRIELDGDNRVVSIRSYDPLTQLSLADCERVAFGRANEVAVGADAVQLLDHAPGSAILIEPRVNERQRRFVRLVQDDLAARCAKIDPTAVLVDFDDFQAAVSAREMIEIGSATEVPRFVEGRAPLRVAAKAITAAISDGRHAVLIGSDRDLRFLRPRLAKALKVEPFVAASWAEAMAVPNPGLATLAMPVPSGWQDANTFVIAAADLLGSRAVTSDTAFSAPAALELAAADIHIGDVIVHEYHGIAVVVGLDALPGDKGDAIVVEHARGARRLVPVAEAHRIWRYGADTEAVTLDSLDGASWEKRRDDVGEAIATTARELIALAKTRTKLTCPVIDPDISAYEAFVAGFPFEPTADQARAITAVRNDLARGKPVDRLIVGDVGYGKTEVALRAAALAALAGRQVVIAAPTTVLVRQHLETFQRRFMGTGIGIAGLSRLSTGAEAKATKAGLAKGNIQIVIGTAAVAGKTVTYKDVGLVVIDEEQRFGSADKTKLRALANGNHVLTLTATPIPRTLQMALSGLQPVSVIATPPARRQPIRTVLAELDDGVLAAALAREHGRRGQSFVVVPRIEDIESMSDRLNRLVPALRTRVAHGKLSPAEIDTVMIDFANGEGDVLLATNIIEAGLDVPRANTMVIHRADRFGLSQLHQLRGRVGRGGRRGQVLLLTDRENPIAAPTLRRLKTLEAFDRLGAGFMISARDLDMRGAGDLVGDAQAGHMKLIGVDLTQHLLKNALRVASGEQVDDWTTVLNIGLPAALPEAWLPDADVRLGLYVRLARCTDTNSLDLLETEIEDRFGAVPAVTRALLDTVRIRIIAREAGIARVDAGPAAIALSPRRPSTPSEPFVEKDGRWLLPQAIADPCDRVATLIELLEAL